MQRVLRAVTACKWIRINTRTSRSDAYAPPTTVFYIYPLIRFSSNSYAQLQSSGRRSWRGQWFVCLVATLLPPSPRVML